MSSINHYFINDPDLKNKEINITYFFKGKQYTFISNSGVFSSLSIDVATDLLIKTIPPLDGSLLDMGCGYGCIGIVLAKEYSLELTQVDINQRVIDLTKINCEVNDVKSNVLLSDSFNNVTGCFDTITINPPIHAGKSVIYDMYEGSLQHLNNNGKLYVVIQKKHGAESTVKKLNQVFGHCEILYKKKGYYILCCTKTV